MALALTAAVLAGCSGGGGLSDAQENTARFGDDGRIEVVVVESFTESYYDEDELSQQIEQELDAYNSGGQAVENKGLTVSDGTARLTLSYVSSDDYTAFNGQEMYFGTVSGAQEAGYELTSLLSAVSTQDPNKILASKDLETLADSHIVIVTEPFHIETPYDILYASDNVMITAAAEADVTGEVSVQEPAMLILTQ